MNYRDAVKYYASTKDKQVFDNKGSEHAANVIENIIKYSNECVYIYSGFLDKEVADEKNLIKEVTLAIKNNKKIYLFLERLPEDNEESIFYKKLNEASHNNNNVTIKIATEDFENELSQTFKSATPLHFAVNDNNAFRVEIDKELFKAKCSFNYPKYTSILIKIFTNHF